MKMTRIETFTQLRNRLPMYPAPPVTKIFMNSFL
jgi:hypothetical protein